LPLSGLSANKSRHLRPSAAATLTKVRARALSVKCCQTQVQEFK
jgi:hypothetical protein